MNIIFTKKRTVFTAALTVALLSFLVVFRGEFLNKNLTFGPLLFALSILTVLLIGLISLSELHFREHTGNIVNTVLLFLLPVVSITMVECLNGVFVYDFYYVDFLNNYILYLLFYGVVFALCGSYRLTVMIINPVLFLFALANYYVFTFKGSPFVPMDFMSIGTAKEVALTYNYTPNYQVAVSIVLLAAIMVLGFKLKTPRMHKGTKILSRTTPAIAMLAVVFIFFFSDLFAHCGLEPDFWNQTRGYHNSGFLLNFCLNTKYIHLNKPSGYDKDKVATLLYDELSDQTQTAANTQTDTESKTDSSKSNSSGAGGISDTKNDKSIDKKDKSTSGGSGTKTKPNIICIMNESLSDLSVCGDFTTNVDYMPFLRSLKTNTVRGNLYVPVHGSGTSNTEYEFLTGNSTSFFPAGSNAYMLYVNHNTSSLVSTLAAQGYSSLAFHPYYSGGWNRTNVYNFFGFERFFSITSAIRPSILVDYINSGYNNAYLNQLCEEYYPGQNVLLRQYVSDEYNYDKVIQYYEDRDPDKPFFLFNVTMQNHGGYSSVSTNFESDVKITSTKKSYPLAEQYLSLVKKSDEAFEDLVDYFNTVDEPTILCLFGDHQPSIEEDFYKEIMGVKSLDSLSLADRQKRYITPFYIYANYDIEESEIEMLSANYLSSYLLKIAGLDMTDYNRYLLSVSKKLPVINTNGSIDTSGNHYENGQKSAYSELLQNYKRIQYNNAIDKDNEQKKLFYLGLTG